MNDLERAEELAEKYPTVTVGSVEVVATIGKVFSTVEARDGYVHLSNGLVDMEVDISQGNYTSRVGRIDAISSPLETCRPLDDPRSLYHRLLKHEHRLEEE